MSSEGQFPGHKEEGTLLPPVFPEPNTVESSTFTPNNQNERSLFPMPPSIAGGLNSELSSNDDHLIDMPPPPPLPPPELRRRDLEETTYWKFSSLDDASKEKLEDASPLVLYKAGMEGNWGEAKNILTNVSNLIRQPITEHGDTILHIAVANADKYFVEKLVSMLQHGDLIKKNKNKDTALTLAAASGAIDIAKVLVEKCKQLLYIRGNQKRLPVHMAILSRHSDMAWYLLQLTNLDTDDQLMLDQQLEILMDSIRSKMFDVAIYLLNKTPELALHRDSSYETPLYALAQHPLDKRKYYWRGIWKTLTRLGRKITQGKYNELSFEEEVVQKVWGQILKQRVETIPNVVGPFTMLFKAAETGNLLVLAPIIRALPDVVLRKNDKKCTIFHVAIVHRQKEVFELIHEVGPYKHWIVAQMDDKNNNMLHLAAQLPRPERLNYLPGAALQMQMELMWFKAVRDVVDPNCAVALNKELLNPWEKFTNEHTSLREKGEDWMRKTAESCNVVATLITTVAFGAIFTIPGGSADSGEPHLQNKPLFMTFAICTAISLFTSSTSIFIFLSILSSRYEMDEFLMSLPLKLMLGLTALFFSIAAMMGAFTAAFFITFRKAAVSWLPIPIALLAVVPVSLFAWQQSPLLLDVFRTTCGSKAFFRPAKSKLFKSTAIGRKNKRR